MTTAGGTNGKGTDRSKINGSCFQLIFSFLGNSFIKMVHAASQISDTHGAGISTAAYSTEGLNLHSAGKGSKSICKPV